MNKKNSPVIIIILMCSFLMLNILFNLFDQGFYKQSAVISLFQYRGITDNGFTGKIIDTINSRVIEYDMIHGAKTGKFLVYFEDGKIAIYGNMKQNMNHGKWEYYYPSGQIESEGFFENDKAQYKWTYYYFNGKIKETGQFKNGERTGVWFFYERDGSVRAKITFINGEKVNDVRPPVPKIS